MSDRSVFIEADWSKQSKRSSVERGERAISASACITSGPKTIAAERGKLQDKNIRYVVLDKKIASEEWRGTGESRATIARTETVRDLVENGPILMRSQQLFSDMYGQGCQGKTCLS